MFFLLDQIIDVLSQFFLVLRVFHDMFHLSKTTLDLNCFGLRILKAKVGKGFFELLQGKALTSFRDSGEDVTNPCLWKDYFEVTAKDHQFSNIDFLLFSMVIKTDSSLNMLSCVEKENFIESLLSCFFWRQLFSFSLLQKSVAPW